MATGSITNEKQEQAGALRVRFIRNTTDDGVDYGPDYERQVADVPYHRAINYFNGGRAVLAEGEAQCGEGQGAAGHEPGADDASQDAAAQKRPRRAQ